jgi:hypothetical protein
MNSLKPNAAYPKNIWAKLAFSEWACAAKLSVYRKSGAGDPDAVIADLEKEVSPFKIEVLEGNVATVGAVGAGKDR